MVPPTRRYRMDFCIECGEEFDQCACDDRHALNERSMDVCTFIERNMGFAFVAPVEA